MMASSAAEVDYEEIVKQLIKKDVVTEKLEGHKNVLDMKRWSFLSNYYESKDEFERAEDTSNAVKTITSNKAAVRNMIDQQHVFLNQKLAHLEQLQREIKTKGQNQSKVFFDNMEECYQEFQKLPNEFDNENMHQMVYNCKKSSSLCDQEITNANKELEILKSIMENFESSADLSNVQAVNEMIEKESFKKYGEPGKLQYRLSEMRQNSEALFKKLQDLKVKYGI